mmetsp:Transcript_2591/g.10308  ORF Transcript_2591/g.10308 Transcript_2591/m.10308 type:complete len:416 (+) Transcript_2591:282-1529(+)
MARTARRRTPTACTWRTSTVFASCARSTPAPRRTARSSRRTWSTPGATAFAVRSSGRARPSAATPISSTATLRSSARPPRTVCGSGTRTCFGRPRRRALSLASTVSSMSTLTRTAPSAPTQASPRSSRATSGPQRRNEWSATSPRRSGFTSSLSWPAPRRPSPRRPAPASPSLRRPGPESAPASPRRRPRARHLDQRPEQLQQPLTQPQWLRHRASAARPRLCQLPQRRCPTPAAAVPASPLQRPPLWRRPLPCLRHLRAPSQPQQRPPGLLPRSTSSFARFPPCCPTGRHPIRHTSFKWRAPLPPLRPPRPRPRLPPPHPRPLPHCPRRTRSSQASSRVTALVHRLVSVGRLALPMQTRSPPSPDWTAPAVSSLLAPLRSPLSTVTTTSTVKHRPRCPWMTSLTPMCGPSWQPA